MKQPYHTSRQVCAHYIHRVGELCLHRGSPVNRRPATSSIRFFGRTSFVRPIR